MRLMCNALLNIMYYHCNCTYTVSPIFTESNPTKSTSQGHSLYLLKNSASHGHILSPLTNRLGSNFTEVTEWICVISFFPTLNEAFYGSYVGWLLQSSPAVQSTALSDMKDVHSKTLSAHTCISFPFLFPFPMFLVLVLYCSPACHSQHTNWLSSGTMYVRM